MTHAQFIDGKLAWMENMPDNYHKRNLLRDLRTFTSQRIGYAAAQEQAGSTDSSERTALETLRERITMLLNS